MNHTSILARAGLLGTGILLTLHLLMTPRETSLLLAGPKPTPIPLRIPKNGLLGPDALFDISLAGCDGSCTSWLDPNRPSTPSGMPSLVTPFLPSGGETPDVTCPPGCFCHQDSFYNEYYAVDYALPGGRSFPVVAATGGTLVRNDEAGATGGTAYVVFIDYGNGWRTKYAHLSEVRVRGQVINDGDSIDVSQGETIGTSGDTGTIPGNVHLHFELRYGGGNYTACDSYSYPLPTFDSVTYDSEWTSQNAYNVSLRPEEDFDFVVRWRNTGSATWYRDDTATDGHPVRMGTQRPQDRESDFYTPNSNWVSPSRIRLNESSVSPGSEGSFTIRLTVPSDKAPGSYDEWFNLVAEGIEWFGNVDVGIIINVLEPLPPPGGCTCLCAASCAVQSAQGESSTSATQSQAFSIPTFLPATSTPTTPPTATPTVAFTPSPTRTAPPTATSTAPPTAANTSSPTNTLTSTVTSSSPPSATPMPTATPTVDVSSLQTFRLPSSAINVIPSPEKPSSESYRILGSVVGVGGGVKTSTNYQIQSTTGQSSSIAWSSESYQSSESFRLSSGYWGTHGTDAACYVSLGHVQTVANLWRQNTDPTYDCDGDNKMTVADIMCWVARMYEPCP